jgi:hypothetical protein
VLLKFSIEFGNNRRLALLNIHELDIEALSNNAILIKELPLYFVFNKEVM